MSKVNRLREMREAKHEARAKEPTGKAARPVPCKDVAKSDGLTGRRDGQEQTLIAEKLTKAIAGAKGGKIGGKAKSPAKTAAAQANGKKGGKPKAKPA